MYTPLGYYVTILPPLSALSHVREFTPAVVYRPMADERKGVASLTQFVSREEEMEWVESLRGLGLTQHEIE